MDGTSGKADGELVERAGELEQIRRVLHGAKLGEGGLVLCMGSAGVGKSSLLAAVEQCADGSPSSLGTFSIIKARGMPTESRLPLGIVTQLFSENAIEDLLGDADPGSSLAIHHGLLLLTRRLCAERPLAMLVDDAQWADTASLRVLHYLAQRRAGLRLAVMLAIRTGEPGADQEPLATLLQDPGAIVLTPAPLSESGVGEVVKRTLPDAKPTFCRSISRATSGNPWYVKALVRLVVEEGIPPTEAGKEQLSGRTPPTLRRELRERLGRMSDSERQLARAAAVLGDGAELHQVARVAGLDTLSACQAADSLCECGIFRQASPVYFSHPIVTDSIRDGLGQGQHAYLELLAARVLHEDHASPQRVAVHLLDAYAGRERWVVEVLWKAAAQARTRGATETAIAFLERALREGGGLDQRAEILFELGLAEAMAGRVRGVKLISEAAEELESPEARAGALIKLGRILGIRSRYDASIRVFRAAREALAEDHSDLAWQAEAGEVISGTQHPPTRHRCCERLEKMLTRPGIERLPIGRDLLAIGALERVFTAQPRNGALELAERVLGLEPEDIEVDGAAFRITSSVLAMVGEVEASDLLSEKLETLARRQGSRMERAALFYPRLLAATERGQIAEMRELATESVEVSRIGWGTRAPNAISALSLIYVEAGEMDEAGEVLDSMGGERAIADTLMFPVWLEARGLIALHRDDPEAALRDFERAGDIRDRSGFITPALSWLGWRSGAALSHFRLGRPDIARLLAQEDLALAERTGIPRSIGNAQRSLGLVTGGERGLGHLRAAVSTHRISGSALEQARSLIALGAALRRSGRRRECREPLRNGLDLARRCGAARLARKAADELRASGARLGTRALSGIAALTPAEKRCAELAATGLTNRQIAARLYLSSKTVEHHLSSTYRKLGISSRRSLATALGQGAARTVRPVAA